MRETVKLRTVGTSVVVSLPQTILEPLTLGEGDRVIIEADPPRRIVITKEGVSTPLLKYLEMEIQLLEKKIAAIESDLRYKERQHNEGHPCEPGMNDNDLAILTMLALVRDRDRLDVDLAAKRLELLQLEGQAKPSAPKRKDSSK